MSAMVVEIAGACLSVEARGEENVKGVSTVARSRNRGHWCVQLVLFS